MALIFLKKLVEEHLNNDELIRLLNFDFITREKCIENGIIYPSDFFDNFKTKLQDAYHNNALYLELSQPKIDQFENSTKNILESTFRNIMRLSRDSDVVEVNPDKWFVNGQRTVQSKDAFSENPEAHHMNFDSFLAEFIADRNYQGLAEIFLRKTTKTYLLKSEDFFKGIDQLNLNENFVLVNFGINIDHYINFHKINKLSNDFYGNTPIYSFKNSHVVRESMFVINRDDLPYISTRIVDEEIKVKYQLKKISDEINLYTSVMDLNKSTSDFINEHGNDKTEDELRKSVLLNINITAEYKWKQNIKVVQLTQYSEFFHKGLSNNINEVGAFE